MFNRPRQITEQTQRVLQRMDNIYHCVLLGLERLELYLECKRLNGAKPSLISTAMYTHRDNYNYQEDCLDGTVIYQDLNAYLTSFGVATKRMQAEDLERYHNDTIGFFLEDMLQWYGGRDQQIPYNDVEAAIVPILLLLSHKCDNSNIEQAFETYVAAPWKDVKYSDEELKEGVLYAFKQYLVAAEKAKTEQLSEVEFIDGDFSFTSHQRGAAVDGYKRLFAALVDLFNDVVPAKVLVHMVKQYCPNVAEQCPAISEEIVDELILKKQNKMSGESNTPDCGEKCDSTNKSEVQPIQDYKTILAKFCNKLEVLIEELRKEIDAQ